MILFLFKMRDIFKVRGIKARITDKLMNLGSTYIDDTTLDIIQGKAFDIKLFKFLFKEIQITQVVWGSKSQLLGVREAGRSQP